MISDFYGSGAEEPANGLTLGSEGAFYGTTRYGGASGSGVAFRVYSDGLITVLASFGEPDPVRPVGGVIEGRDGHIYGAASFAGENGYGGIFHLSLAGTASTVTSFASETGSPTRIAQAANGNFYGAFGGRGNDQGSVFEVTPTGDLSTVANLDTTTGYDASDFLIGKDGELYGLTRFGGAHDAGTIFRMAIGGAIERLSSLTVGGVNSGPFLFSRENDGNFYGTGWAGQGTIFKVNTSGVQTTLYQFDDLQPYGAFPAAGVFRGANGSLYGTTNYGGATDGDFQGTIFRLSPDGQMSTLLAFPADTGKASTRLLLMPDGSFYGTTPRSLFRRNPDDTIEFWEVFDDRHAPNNVSPSGPLTVASDGYVYGTTEDGGTFAGGTVFRFTTLPPVLASFTPATARPGTRVVLTGKHLAGTSAVTFNGVAASFTIENAGQITAIVPTKATSGAIALRNPLGTASKSSFEVLPAAAQALNLSTRAAVQDANGVVIGGLIVNGSAPKKILLRAIGPSLAVSGLANPLPDPVMELRNANGQLIASNDNWKVNDATGQSQEDEIRQTSIAPPNDLECAVMTSVAPNQAYTAVVRGREGAEGLVLVEMYDLDAGADSFVANLSTRAVIGTGDNVLIGGFILGAESGGGEGLLVRAIGPSLANAGAGGPLMDPTLELRDVNGALLASNDDWKIDSATQQSQEGAIRTTTIPPSDDHESAILTALPPGPYTAIVAGKGGTPGVGLVEVYTLR